MSAYKEYRFSDLIEEVEERNISLEYGLDDIVGVTIEKGLIPTIANLTQTALDKFYIVKPDTFVYNPRTHGVRLGMGYNDTNKTFLTSWNNVAFRVKEDAKKIVLSKYLWIYFNRPEWDRQTNFMAWGSSTIVFAWNDFLSIKIQLPDLKEQEKIVNTYNAITKCIQLKQKINENLEKTAQCLFEKSCNNENTEITLGEIVKFIDGDRGSNYPTLSDFYDDEYCLFLNASNVTEKGFNFDKCQFITEEKDKSLRKGHLSYNDIVLTSRGTVGNVALYTEMIQYKNVRINSGMLIIRPNENKISVFVLYALLRSIFMKKEIERFRSGSVQPQLPVRDLEKMIFRIPNKENCSMLNQQFKIIYESITTNFNEIAKLQELKQLVISRISGIQGEG